MKVFDLTHYISEDMLVYPGTEGPTITPANTHERDGFAESVISMFTHTGTHIDPPAHIVEGAMTLDAFDISTFIGRAQVIDCRHIQEGGSIGMDTLFEYRDTLGSVDFLLFLTGWDKRWGTEAYFRGFPCIDEEVLEFIIASGYKGIGFDTISLDRVEDADLPRHRRLFGEKNIINIENLSGLERLGREPVMLACLPIKTKNADGAPARAIAWIE